MAYFGGYLKIKKMIRHGYLEFQILNRLKSKQGIKIIMVPYNGNFIQ